MSSAKRIKVHIWEQAYIFHCDSDIRNLRYPIRNNDLQASFACRTTMESHWETRGRTNSNRSGKMAKCEFYSSKTLEATLNHRLLTHLGGSVKDGQLLRRAPMTDIWYYVYTGIELLLRFFLDPPFLQPPEGWCQRQLYVKSITKVVCMRGD